MLQAQDRRSELTWELAGHARQVSGRPGCRAERVRFTLSWWLGALAAALVPLPMQFAFDIKRERHKTVAFYVVLVSLIGLVAYLVGKTHGAGHPEHLSGLPETVFKPAGKPAKSNVFLRLERLEAETAASLAALSSRIASMERRQRLVPNVLLPTDAVPTAATLEIHVDYDSLPASAHPGTVVVGNIESTPAVSPPSPASELLPTWAPASAAATTGATSANNPAGALPVASPQSPFSIVVGTQ